MKNSKWLSGFYITEEKIEENDSYERVLSDLNLKNSYSEKGKFDYKLFTICVDKIVSIRESTIDDPLLGGKIVDCFIFNENDIPVILDEETKNFVKNTFFNF